MADYKPADLFVGLVDFLAVLLPGSLLVYLLLPVAGGVVGTFLPPLETELQRWAGFLVAAYVAGHFLHLAGDRLLDRHVYDRWYVKKKRRGREERFLVETRKLMGDFGKFPDVSAFQWAGSFVRLRSSRAADEVERLGAESKFFRSLSLVAAIAAVMAGFRGCWLIAVCAALIALFALRRYCERRWTTAQRTYEYFVMLTRDPRPATVDDAVASKE